MTGDQAFQLLAIGSVAFALGGYLVLRHFSKRFDRKYGNPRR